MAKLKINPYYGIDWNTVQHIRTNLHGHIYDHGSAHPHQYVDWYRHNGYKALAITEHNRMIYPWTDFSNVEYPYNPPPEDEPWEDRDPEGLGMIDIPGNEISTNFHDRLSLFTTYLPREHGHSGQVASPSLEDHKFILNEIKNRGGVVIYAHPGLYWDIGREYDENEFASPEWYENLFKESDTNVLLGLEVYNARNKHPYDRVLWDILLTKLMPDRPIWGFANDDLHGAGYMGISYTWQLLDEGVFNREGVKQAMIKGSFFTSHAYRSHTRDRPPNRPSITPKISSVIVDEDNKSITINATEYERIEWVCGIIGQGVNRRSRVVHIGNTFSYDGFSGNYVRAEVIGVETEGRQNRTLTQPFGFEVDDAPIDPDPIEQEESKMEFKPVGKQRIKPYHPPTYPSYLR